MAKYITSADVKGLIDTIKNGELFSMVFNRVAAKCPKCNKANKKWNGLDVCPICGTPLSKERFTRAQLGVVNPTNTTAPGKGLYEGESGEEALAKGRLKYFDMDAEGKLGGHGNYRQTYIENIKRLAIRGEEYVVIK